MFLRLFAPFLPFATEEIWSWWQPGSVHKAAWPTEAEILAVAGGGDDRGAQALQMSGEILGAVRKKKSEDKRPLNSPVARLVVRAPEDKLDLLPDIEQDLRASGQLQQIDTIVTEVLQVDVELAPPEGVPRRPE